MVVWYNTKDIKIDEKLNGDQPLDMIIFTEVIGRSKAFWFLFPCSPQQSLLYHILWFGHGRWIAQPPKSGYVCLLLHLYCLNLLLHYRYQ